MSEVVGDRHGVQDLPSSRPNEVDGTRSNVYIASGFFSLAGILVCGSLLDVPYEAKSALAVTVVLAALMLGTASLRLSRTGGDPFDPMFLITLVLTFYFVFHAMWLLVDPSRLNLDIRRPFVEEMVRSQAYLMLAYSAMLFGFVVVRARSATAQSRRVVSETPMRRLFLIFALGMLFNFLAFTLGAYSKSTENGFTLSGNFRVLRTVGFFSFVAYVGALLRITTTKHRSSGKEKLVVYAVMLPVQIAWAFVTGTKSEAFFAVFALLLVRNYQIRLLTVRQIVASVAAFVVFVMPLIQTTRLQTRAGNLTSSGDIGHAIDRFPNEIKAIAHGGGLLDGLKILQARTNGSESFALATKYTPTLRGYQFGRSWVSIPLAVVPRFLWHAKPNYTPTRDFSEIYGGQSLAAGNGLALAPTFPGDLYMNFGIVGLLGGFVALGAFLRALTQQPGMGNASRERRVFWYAVLSVSIVVLEQDVGSLVSTTLLHAFVAVTFLSVCARRTQRIPSLQNRADCSVLVTAEQ
jgi:hypothetical protein